eukprot:jgi/Botrbrau1/22077/Bobra.0206s0005.1
MEGMDVLNSPQWPRGETFLVFGATREAGVEREGEGESLLCSPFNESNLTCTVCVCPETDGGKRRCKQNRGVCNLSCSCEWHPYALPSTPLPR